MSRTADRIAKWRGFRPLIEDAVERFRALPMAEIGAGGVISWTLSVCVTVANRCGPLDFDSLEEINRAIHEVCFARGIGLVPALEVSGVATRNERVDG